MGGKVESVQVVAKTDVRLVIMTGIEQMVENCLKVQEYGVPLGTLVLLMLKSSIQGKPFQLDRCDSLVTNDHW